MEIDQLTEQPKDSPQSLVGLGKESGEIEFGADSVMVLAREQGAEGEPPWPLWVAIAAGRAVQPRWVRLAFDGGRVSQAGVWADG